jgi:hypothetical protein
MAAVFRSGQLHYQGLNVPGNVATVNEVYGRSPETAV